MPRKTTTIGESVKLPPDIKTVKKVRRSDGSVKIHYYRRSTGKPIKGQPGTLLFEASWAAAGQTDGSPASTRGELFDLIQRYRKAPEAKRKSVRSDLELQRYLNRIEDKFGYMSLDLIQHDKFCQDLYVWRDEMGATPVAADHTMSTLSTLLNWARRRKHIRINQAQDVDRLIDRKEKVKRNRSRLIFTPDMEEEIFAIAHPVVRASYLLSYYTGARRGDMCDWKWSSIDGDGWLVYTPAKTEETTGAEVHLPVFALPPLKELLDSLPRRPHGYILSNTRGGRMTSIALKKHWERTKKKTSIKLHWHDLRGTTITHLLNAQCTLPEVASISGHAMSSTGGAVGDSGESSGSVSKVISAYAQHTRDMALNAYTKWATAEFSPKPKGPKKKILTLIQGDLAA
jgi:integrase